MARPRNPDREKAFQLWSESAGKAKLKDIAEQLGVPDSRIRKWKAEDKWDEKIKERSDTDKGALLNTKENAPKKKGPPFGSQNAKGHGAPKGNKNALGNKGGKGPPPGSKNALKTGEHETIWYDTLTDEEKALYGKINTNTLAQVEQSIIFLSFRERRMMERIKKLMDGLTEKERRILSELREEKQEVELYDEKTASTKTVLVPVPKMVVTNIAETQSRAIDDILRIEDGLTRVQQQKARYIALKHTIENDARGEGGDIANEHAQRLQEAWAKRC
ncbi:terminase|uniref:Uncharacterized protein YjcR n=1 Tax=Dendrosporobacter quercicolus TaxID=146817 RepID=A0A1G9ZRG6_9FIRM|nr:phage terminase small subunit-related protein [Dendrosporobacter quercicolus]NSL49584.1 terminase [Dendrosporobacter quercicolus DSM 1736]SDN23705.1 Uncharacterized protein YjcR [Dendrosporobacter quercicolus]